jgi:hypothetical protein
LIIDLTTASYQIILEVDYFPNINGHTDIDVNEFYLLPNTAIEYKYSLDKINYVHYLKFKT